MVDKKQKIEDAECVKVAVRCRPMNSKEIERGSVEVVSVNESEKTITLNQPGERADARKFTYDYVYGVNSTQQ